MYSNCKRFTCDENGSTAIEYALMGSLLALVLVAALTALGTGLSSEFTEISGALK
jgi:pilus assembly protein Flp/PilA